MTTMFLGGAAIDPQGLGDLFRALQPGTAANPIASLAEHTFQDAPDAPRSSVPTAG
ncbi:hypothetical protein [Actinacidiphila oryziradicis]|uniref:hypothetical protein n=1 Tax=Actinacidiphila oryziradicis TaxID=2571141 RepID=UPI00145D9CB0|nr:hypothetical protein [Actinacidiphila oryziradicis]